jgi:hypothetical protein
VCVVKVETSSSVRYVSLLFLFFFSHLFDFHTTKPFFKKSCFFFSISFFFSFRRVVYGRTASNCCAPPRLANPLKLKKKKEFFFSSRIEREFLIFSSFFFLLSFFLSISFGRILFSSVTGVSLLCVCVYGMYVCMYIPSGVVQARIHRPPVVAKDQQRWFSYSAAGFSISKMDSFAS